MAMPVYKRGGYDGNVTFTFTVDIINDTDKPAKFYLTDVDAGGDLPADEAILTIPPAGMDTVTLDAQTQAKLGTPRLGQLHVDDHEVTALGPPARAGGPFFTPGDTGAPR